MTSDKANWVQAHLTEEYGLLVPSNETDGSALLKARTLLAYLMDTNKLTYKIHNASTDSMVIVCNKASSENVSDELMDEMWALLNNPASLVSTVVMYRPFEPIVAQPGLAFLKADITTNHLFSKVWLKSSLTWLRKHPQDRVALDLTFPN